MDFQNKKVFYTMGKGCGNAETELNAFDRALLVSGIANYNLIEVSSILPPNAEFALKVSYREGSLLPVAIAKRICEPTEKRTTIAAAVAVGIPEDEDIAGVMMEWSGQVSEEVARDKVVFMIETAMKDRGISRYSIKVSSVEEESSEIYYVCVLAYAALFLQENSFS